MTDERIFLFGARVVLAAIAVARRLASVTARQAGTESVSFNLADLELIFTPWDKQANFLKLAQ